MLAVRLVGDSGFAITWVLSVAAIVAGLLMWHRAGWKTGWASVMALVGFETVWRSILLASGLLTVSGRGFTSRGALWFAIAWRSIFGDLPWLIALIVGVMLAWSTAVRAPGLPGEEDSGGAAIGRE